MKKVFGIALVLAVLTSLCFGSVALAAPGTVVVIDADTDRLENDVSGSFTSGTFNWALDASTGTHSVVTTMNVSGANLVINSAGKDITHWHTGTIGQWNDFQGIGDFAATYQTFADGNYGDLQSYINASSGASGADFQMWDTQDFDVMSANWGTNVDGYFYAQASGGDNQVAMNLKSIGSMYVWSEATNGGPGLQGNDIEKDIWTWQSGAPKTHLNMSVSTTGIATISNSAAWGWGIGARGGSTTHYNGGTRTVSATGTGIYNQSGAGANYLDFNGFTFPTGGSMGVIANFVGGFSGTYSMNAN